MLPLVRRSEGRSAKYPMQEPAMRAGRGVLAVAGAVDPEALADVILDPEIVAHGDQLCITLPPFAEQALGAICALHAPSDTAPGECHRRMIRQLHDRLQERHSDV